MVLAVVSVTPSAVGTADRLAGRGQPALRRSSIRHAIPERSD
jgi:hypothetical protein